VDELKAVFDPRGGQWVNRQYVPSLLAAIGGVIEEHMLAIGFLSRATDAPAVTAKVAMISDRLAPAPETAGPLPGGVPDLPSAGLSTKFCPRCSSPGLIRLEGCDTCLNCGHSRCG
ncbi:MAG: ribonucleoside-diphosphate reductase, adenosylcobalamin-dependent, partial [Alphaproteobacteria bacterium]